MYHNATNISGRLIGWRQLIERHHHRDKKMAAYQSLLSRPMPHSRQIPRIAPVVSIITSANLPSRFGTKSWWISSLAAYSATNRMGKPASLHRHGRESFGVGFRNARQKSSARMA